MNDLEKERFHFYFWYLSTCQRISFLKRYGLISKESPPHANKNTEWEKYSVPWCGNDLLLSSLVEKSVFQTALDDIKGIVENDPSYWADKKGLAEQGHDDHFAYFKEVGRI